MPRGAVLETLVEIQSVFPRETMPRLAAELWEPRSLARRMAALLDRFPPVFLPVFQWADTTFAVHVTPHRTWRQSPWVALPHDSQNAEFIASDFEHLGVGFLASPYVPARKFETAWELMAEVSSQARVALPDKQGFAQACAQSRLEARARFDPLNVAARMYLADSQAVDKKMAAEAVLKIAAQHADDVLALFGEMLARKAKRDPDAGRVASKILMREVAWATDSSGEKVFPEAFLTSPWEILERARKVVMRTPKLDGPLEAMRKVSYDSMKGVQALKTVAESYRDSGDHLTALWQLRNAAWSAGWSLAMSEGWCRELAEYSERVEPGGLASALATFAAQAMRSGEP